MSINPTAGPSAPTGAGSKSDSSFEDILSGAEQKKQGSEKGKLVKQKTPRSVIGEVSNGIKSPNSPPPIPKPNNGNNIRVLNSIFAENGFSIKGTKKNDTIQANDRTTNIDGGKGKDLVRLPDNAKHVRMEKQKGGKVIVAYNTTNNRSDNSSRVILTLKNVESVSAPQGIIETKNLKTDKKQNIEDVKGFVSQKELRGSFK